MSNVIPLRPAPADWSVLGECAHELGVLAVAIEHLRAPGDRGALSAGGLATLEALPARLRAELDRIVECGCKAGALDARPAEIARGG